MKFLYAFMAFILLLGVILLHFTRAALDLQAVHARLQSQERMLMMQIGHQRWLAERGRGKPTSIQ